MMSAPAYIGCRTAIMRSLSRQHADLVRHGFWQRSPKAMNGPSTTSPSRPPAKPRERDWRPAEAVIQRREDHHRQKTNIIRGEASSSCVDEQARRLSKMSADRERINLVVPSTASQHTPMHLSSRARTRAGLTGSLILALLVLAPGASTSFAAEKTSPLRLTTVQHEADGDFDPTVIYHENTQGIIMRDGGVCDPIRHMGC